MTSDDDSLPDRGFAAGTRLFTARGEVPVERLAPGDMIVTLSGRGPPLKPIRAIADAPGDAVRLAAGALGSGVPARALVVGAGQLLRVEGALIPARDLVNGACIRAEPATRLLRVDLAQHDLLIAEGAAAATPPDPAAAEDPGRVAAIRATLAARADPAATARHPAEALLDRLIAGDDAPSARIALETGAATFPLGAPAPDRTDG